MFFKNAQLYRLPAPWAMTAQALAAALEPHAFTPASSNELLRQGWAAPRGGELPLVHVVADQYLLQVKSEKKLLPSTVINQVAKARAAEVEEAQGFVPGKKAMKELKERVADELLPRAFAIESTTNVWIDPKNGWLVVDAASLAKADEVIKLLLKAVDRMPLESLRVQRSPVAVMTDWLQADEAPTGFTVDRDAIMRATGESKAQVAYKRHTLEADEVRRHIAAGKQCTRLAMTWDSKISFVLDESLAIKSIKPLDVLKENESSTKDADERFDSDFALMTGELSGMFADLVQALGGEATMDAPGEQKRAVPAAAKRDDTTVTVTFGGSSVSFGPDEAALLDERIAASRAAGKVQRCAELADELHAARDSARKWLEGAYETTIQELGAEIRAAMEGTDLNEIQAAIRLAHGTEDARRRTFYLAAAVELVEPSGGRSKEEMVADGVIAGTLGVYAVLPVPGAAA